MEKFEEREAVTLTNEGEKIFGIFHRPLVKGKVPAVLICPGFGGTKSGKYRLYVTLSEELARHGIAVFRFDYRGVGDSEGSFDDITIDGKLSDTLLCLNYLEKDPTIDSSRIGILGRSLGGAIAVLAAKKYPSIKSMALWAPLYTSEPWKKMWEMAQSNPELLKTRTEMIGMPLPNLKFVQQFLQINLENDLMSLKQVPLLHIHGEKDATVKFDQANGYKNSRQGCDKSLFISLPQGDHEFSDKSDQKLTVAATCQWYKDTL